MRNDCQRVGPARSAPHGKVAALALLLLLGGSGMAAAQVAPPVATQASVANSSEGSSTITANTTFQLLWAATAAGGPYRRGCLVLNTAAHEQYVYFQGPGMTPPTAGNSSALRASSIPLDPPQGANLQGGSVSCGTGTGSALQDSIWISGTINDTFVAKQQ